MRCFTRSGDDGLESHLPPNALEQEARVPPIIRPGLDGVAQPLVDIPVGQANESRSKGFRLEDTVTAFAGAKLERRRPRGVSSGKENLDIQNSSGEVLGKRGIKNADPDISNDKATQLTDQLQGDTIGNPTAFAVCPSSLRRSFSADLATWIHDNAVCTLHAEAKDYPWGLFFLFGIWNIWLQRNRKTFKHLAVNPDLLLQVESQTREFIYCVASPKLNGTMITKEVKWVRPALGWAKLNTDGSFSAGNGPAGCGGIIRGSDGQWVTGFAMSINVSSSIAAELWALREGLSLCLEMHLQAVEVELDASAAISLVSSNCSTNGDLSGLVDDCREMLLRMPQAKMSHCYREANCCADALARIGASSPTVCNRFATPPPSIAPLLFSDFVGLSRNRACPRVSDVLSA
nr:putative ribonuclease h protein [Quercus suber]